MDKKITLEFIDSFDTVKADIEKEVNDTLSDIENKEEKERLFNQITSHIKTEYTLTTYAKQLWEKLKTNAVKVEEDNRTYYIDYPTYEGGDPFNIKITVFNQSKLVNAYYLPLEVIAYCGSLLNTPYDKLNKEIGKSTNPEHFEIVSELAKDLNMTYDKEYDVVNKKDILVNINSLYGKLLHLNGTPQFHTSTFINKVFSVYTFTTLFMVNNDNKKQIVNATTISLTEKLVKEIGSYYNTKQDELKQKAKQKEKMMREKSIQQQIYDRQKEINDLKKQLKKEQNNEK